jgi:hypothetical protein
MAKVLLSIVAVAAAVSAGAPRAQQLTPTELDTVRAFFWGNHSHPGEVEVAGWRSPRPSGQIDAYGYVSFVRPKLLRDRLCVVEYQWIEGVVVGNLVQWASEPFQVLYDVWESGTTGCEVKTPSDIPDHIRVMNEIDAASLIRIVDGQDQLRELSLAFLTMKEREEHKNARLIELSFGDFAYHARFRSNGYGGISVTFSEDPDGFDVHSAGVYMY